jgi:hypothetical protein
MKKQALKEFGIFSFFGRKFFFSVVFIFVANMSCTGICPTQT